MFDNRVAGILHTINDSLGERSHNDENDYEMLFGENLIQENLLGLSFDLFMNTGGIHASACVTMAFARPALLIRLQSESPMDETKELTVFTENSQKYILYTFLLSFVFFFWLFLLEEFSFRTIHVIVLKSFLSSFFSSIIIILGQYLLFRKPKN